MNQTQTPGTSQPSLTDPNRVLDLLALHIIDTPQEERFDRITRTACKLLNVPIAMMNFVDASNTWLKSRQGVDVCVVPNDTSFCSHAVRENRMLVIDDAANDVRFMHNPLVTGELHFRAYAGIPVRGLGGYAIGALCIFDTVPRIFTEEEMLLLADLTHFAQTEIDSIKLAQAMMRIRDTEEKLTLANQGLEVRVAERTTELELALAAAEVANNAKSAFLANMSHEIRTPLNAVLGMAQLAIHDNPTPTHRNYLEKILANGDSLIRIVEDIMDFSKMEAGKLTIEQTEVFLQKEIGDLVESFHSSAKKKGIGIVIEPFEQVPAVLYGDPLRLMQILGNYLSNAIKFTSSGEIRVRTRAINKDTHSCLLQVDVTDTGIGIPATDLKKIFHSFEQGDTSTTRRFGGTGLGLAISRQLAQMMGGDVGVTSVPGQGSTFTFRVRLGTVSPQKPQRELSQRTSIEALSEAMRGLSILVVEDNPFNQEITQAMLHRCGASVVLAENGAVALEKLDHHQFDCVLMDIQMPVMDGYTATKKIREQAAFQALPVVALTANAFASDRDRCRVAGVTDMITKPVDLAGLYSSILNAIASVTHPATMPHAFPPKEDSDTDQCVIDFSVLEEMLGGDPATLRRFADMFLQTADGGISEIADALKKGDLASTRATGHRIKSSARSVGAAAFAKMCENLEHAEDLDLARAVFAEMAPLLDRIRNQVNTKMV